MKGEKLTVASQNVRCLGQGFIGRRKRKEIKDIFKNTKHPTDILVLHEVKLPENACMKQARFIEPKGGTSFWNEGTFSAQTCRFTGGTGIVLAEHLIQSITNHGVLYPCRAQYITLQLSSQLDLGIINIYGFSKTGPRTMLWNHLAQSNLPEAHWILVGDFNNIEHSRDKQGGASKNKISNRKLEAWNRLLTGLGVRDSFHVGAFAKQSDKAFTWTNFRKDDTLIQSHIDRIYIPLQVELIGGTMEILPTIQDVSDHAGVTLHFNNEARRKQRTPTFNKGLLKNEESKNTLLETWKKVMADATLETWNQKMVAANHAIRLKSEELTKNQRKK